MKTLKKALALMLALTVVFAYTAVGAFAADGAVITVDNAAQGETYKVVKIFDATYNTTTGAIAYTGDIPSGLSDYFEKNSDNQIVVKQGVDLNSEAVVTAIKQWADGQTPVDTQVGDGSAITFSNLDYGYYVVTTTQGALVSLTSLKPSATVYDKNEKVPVVNKEADGDSYNIGDTITYTVTFNAPAYEGAGSDAKQVTKYILTDTLPSFLSDAHVTSIVIKNKDESATEATITNIDFDNKQIVIPWVDDSGKTKYSNDAHIIVTYTATLTDQATIDGDGNKNEVTLTSKVKSPEGGEEPGKTNLTDDDIVYTYAAALQKVDENKKPLAGAKFKATGLIATGSAGVYTVSSFDATANAGKETVLECDGEGQLVILGLKQNNALTLTETEAPAGYNILADTATMTPVKTGEEVTATEKTIYYDANGNVTSEETQTSYTKTTYNVNLLKTAIVVVNKKGAELPSTGGIGTTIFYILGAILVLGAGILLITRRRMATNK